MCVLLCRQVYTLLLVWGIFSSSVSIPNRWTLPLQKATLTDSAWYAKSLMQARSEFMGIGWNVEKIRTAQLCLKSHPRKISKTQKGEVACVLDSLINWRCAMPPPFLLRTSLHLCAKLCLSACYVLVTGLREASCACMWCHVAVFVACCLLTECLLCVVMRAWYIV